MSRTSVKRIDGGEYKIYADKVTINGNLDVIGTTTNIETINSFLKDRVIGLNVGEAGAGVSAPGVAGFGIDRGSLPDVALLWNENVGAWQVTSNGITYANIATTGSAATAGGLDTTVQFNNATVLDGSLEFKFDYNTNTVIISNIDISGYTITTNATNQNLVLNANGSGKVEIGTEIQLNEQVSDPTVVPGSSLIYVKTSTTNSSGIFYVNNTSSGELVDSNKSLLLSLIL
jgi:hypothetical protein